KFFAFALDDVDVIVGEFAPLLLYLALELFPVAFDAIPIHRTLLLCWCHSGMAGKPAVNQMVPCTPGAARPKQPGRSRKNSTTPRITGRARGGGEWAAGRYNNHVPGVWFPRETQDPTPVPTIPGGAGAAPLYRSPQD